MAIKGVIFKRCSCKDPANDRRMGAACGRLMERGHGRWYFHCSAGDLWGRRERVRRGGFTSQAAARRARDEVLAQLMPLIDLDQCCSSKVTTWVLAS